MKDILKFDKKSYWERRKKGLRGQVPGFGSKEQRKDNRIMANRQMADQLAKLRSKSERTNRKSTKKSV